MTAIFCIGGVWLVACVFLAWLLINAPDGYEDSQGFHLGQQPDTALDTPRAEPDASGRKLDRTGGVLSEKTDA